MRHGISALGLGLTVTLLACLVEVPPLAEPPPPVDAGADVIEASTPETSTSGCAPGAFATPLRTFDANPTAKGDICNLDGVLVKGDGKITGLDRNDATDNVDVGGRPETSCIGIEIEPHALSEIAITVGAAAMGCDVACSGSGCGRSGRWSIATTPSRT